MQLNAYADEIRRGIRSTYSAHLRAARPARTATQGRTAGPPEPISSGQSGLSHGLLTDHVIAIGASTGGTEAIKDLLLGLPPDMPPIVMAQHMAAGFTTSFARRLNNLTQLQVVEAQGGERLLPGHAYLAPGHSHLRIRRRAGGWVSELSQDGPVNRHRPSVDVLFSNVAQEARNKATGIILTGMGKDGAAGLLEMRQAGAWTIGQDQESSVVYGMPREAALVGAVQEVASLLAIPERLLAHLRKQGPAL